MPWTPWTGPSFSGGILWKDLPDEMTPLDAANLNTEENAEATYAAQVGQSVFSQITAQLPEPATLGAILSGASAHLTPSMTGSDDVQITNALANFAPFVSPRIVLGLGTFNVTNFAPTTSVDFIGSGEGTIIKQVAATNADICDVTTNGVIVRFQSLTIDGNQANQTNDASHIYYSVNVTADAASATAPVRLVCSDVTFRNGRAADVFVRKNTADSTAAHFQVEIDKCRFYGGCESVLGFGTTYIQSTGAIAIRAEANIFDLQATPVASGRAGITQDGTPIYGRWIVTNNQFWNVGSIPPGGVGTLGCIDIYAGGHDSIIANNQLVHPYGRGINVKSDASAVSVNGNVVDGLATLNSATPDAQIVVNVAVHNTAGSAMAFNGNVCVNSSRDGIVLQGATTTDGTHAKAFIGSGNVVTNAGRRGLTMIGVDGADVGIMVDGTAEDGIFADACLGMIRLRGWVRNTTLNGIECATTNTAARFDIDMDIEAPGRYGIFIGAAIGGVIRASVRDAGFGAAVLVQNTTAPFLVTGTRATGTNAIFQNGGGNAALWVDESCYWGGGFGSTRTLTLDASGAITVWTNAHQVDTFAAAASQNLITINGLPDGKRLTLRAANTSHVVTVAGGGNITMGGGNKALSFASNSVTLQAWGTLCYETGVI